MLMETPARPGKTRAPRTGGDDGHPAAQLADRAGAEILQADADNPVAFPHELLHAVMREDCRAPRLGGAGQQRAEGERIADGIGDLECHPEVRREARLAGEGFSRWDVADGYACRAARPHPCIDIACIVS